MVEASGEAGSREAFPRGRREGRRDSSLRSKWEATGPALEDVARRPGAEGLEGEEG